MSRTFAVVIMFFLLGFLNISYAMEENLPYDYSSTFSLPIKMNIVEEVTTKRGLLEGSTVNFKVKKDVIYNGQIIVKKDTIIPARVETVIPRGMNGFPAEIVIDNFQFEEIKSSKLLSTYTKKGQNRCLFVYPLKWALTPIPFAGSLTNFILGGEAKIKKSDVITVYYYPDWK